MKSIIISLIIFLSLEASFLESQLRVVFTDIEAQKQAAIDRLSYLRKKAGMVEFQRNSLLDASSQNHSDYLAYNNLFDHHENTSLSYATGYAPSDRISYVGYSWISTGENISAGTTQDGVDSIDQLFSAIYHRFGFLTFLDDEVGIGFTSYDNYAYNNVYVYNMANQSDPTTTMLQNPAYVMWPPDKMKEVMPAFYEEMPDPLPDYEVSGYPISFQLNQAYTNSHKLISFELFDDKNNKVTNTRVLTSSTDPNSKFSNLEYALFPLERLDFSSSYKAVVKIYINEELKEISWSFSTTSFTQPFYEVDSNSANLNIKPNTEYIVYFKPLNKNDIFNSFNASYNFNNLSVDMIDNNTLKIKGVGKVGQSAKIYLYNGSTNSKILNLSLSSSDSSIILDKPIDIENTTTSLVSLEIYQGWNLVSIPVETNVNDMSLFDDYNAIWTYDGAWYSNPSSIESGIGFWINSNKTHKIDFEGKSYETGLNNLQNSTWYLKGAGQQILEPNSNYNIDTIWVFRSNSWIKNPSSIERGEGFWVKK